MLDELYERDEDLADLEPAETSTDFRGQLKTVDDTRAYVLAGRAVFTLVSTKTGKRLTYRVVRSRRQGYITHFVRVLTGSDNTSNYTSLGAMKASVAGVRYDHWRESKISRTATSAVAFDWFWRSLSKGKMPAQLQVWHEGCCGRCGRALTVPESIAQGFGPTCIGKVR